MILDRVGTGVAGACMGALALAGAAAPADDDPPLVLQDCAHQELFPDVPAADVAHLVPEPLQLRVEDGMAGLFVTSLDCRAGEQPARIVWVGVPVEPPEAAAGEPPANFDGHLLGSLHSSEVVAAHFEAWGQGEVEPADIAFDEVGEGGIGSSHTVAGPIALESVAAAVLPPVSIRARFWDVVDGEVVGAMELFAQGHDLVMGTGSIAFEGGAAFGAPTPTTPVPTAWHGDIASITLGWFEPW